LLLSFFLRDVNVERDASKRYVRLSVSWLRYKKEVWVVLLEMYVDEREEREHRAGLPFNILPYDIMKRTIA